MGYQVGIDVGTTFTAAAVRRADRVEMVGLGNRAMQMPSVVFVPDKGHVLVGEAAENRGSGDPVGVVREFKRRMGDPVPILVRGRAYSPETLTARVLQAVVAITSEREGAPPDSITVTHPASWGPYKLQFLQQSLAAADLSTATICAEPVAAAITYARRHPREDLDAIAVYDLGGGTFDTAVLRRQAGAFGLVGQPEGIEHLGGIDIDEVVFRYVIDMMRRSIAELDPDDPDVILALARLRRDCVLAKEQLSTDTQTTVTAALPSGHETVRLGRSELEELVRPALDDTVAALRRALRSAETTPEQLAAIVLVGGSSRIPLVSEALVSAFGRPLAIDTHPKHDVALGAAWGDPPPVHRTAAGSSAPVRATTPATAATTALELSDAVPGGTDRAASTRRRRARVPLVGVGVLILAVVIVLATGAFRSHRDGRPAGASPSPGSPTRPMSKDPLDADVVLFRDHHPGSPTDLYAVSATDGTRRHLIATLPGPVKVVLSHDRRTIAYAVGGVDAETGEDLAFSGALWVMGADGSGARPVFPDGSGAACNTADSASFGPDNDRLALVCDDAAATMEVVDLGGGLIARLATGVVGPPSFSPDGDQIAYGTQSDGRVHLATVTVDAPHTVTLLTPGLGTEHDPEFSPDGTTLLFDRADGAGADICTLVLADRQVRQLISVTNVGPHAHWVPSGNPGEPVQIVYAVNRYDLWIMDADGTQPHFLTT